MRFILTGLLSLGLIFNCYAAGRVTIVNGQGEEVSNTDNELKVDGITEIKTAAQLLDNAVYVDDADWAGTNSHILVGGLYGSNTITSGDVGPILLDASGNVSVVSGADLNVEVTETSFDATHAALTLAANITETTWVTGAGFYTSAAPLTVTTSQATNAGASNDENWAIMLDAKQCAPYIRVVFTGTGTAGGGDDQIVVTGWSAIME